MPSKKPSRTDRFKAAAKKVAGKAKRAALVGMRKGKRLLKDATTEARRRQMKAGLKKMAATVKAAGKVGVAAGKAGVAAGSAAAQREMKAQRAPKRKIAVRKSRS